LISESAWTSIIEGTRNVRFEFLALQLLLVTLRNRWQAGEISTQDCIRELKTFYRKFNRLPVAEKDFRKIANLEEASANGLLDPHEVARRISAGHSLLLAGDEKLLAALPPGNWIGGTIPYFMTQDGGCRCADKIFVTEIPAEYEASIKLYAASELAGLYHDACEGAVSFVILPADSAAHTEFALQAPRYPDFAMHPLVGWIAGTDLARVGREAPTVFCGGPQPRRDGAAVLRLKLPANRLAQIRIVNLFHPGDGDAICFPASGFTATTALVNGREQNFADYLQSVKADTRLPLVANYFGAMVNVSVKSVDPQNGSVEFYAPVVPGIEYKLASPVEDYVAEFEASLKAVAPESVLFSCNCILNYLHSKLEGRRMGALAGPVTFGEIAFQLLNQTLVCLEIIKVASPKDDSNATLLELQAAHDELQASEQRFRTLSESAPVGIFLTDPAGRLLYDNSRCRSLSGISSEEGTSADAFLRNVHPQDLAGVTAAFVDSEANGQEFDREFRFVGADGSIRWVRARTAGLLSETGERLGRIGTVEDVSDRKQAEIELERVNQDLVNASREAGMAEVASGVLHNVKNVINSINVSTGVMLNQLHQSQSPSLAMVTKLLREHADDLGSFVSEDPKGKHLPAYLDQLAARLAGERETLLGELRTLESGVEHIKDIVTMQQSSAKLGGASERARPADLMDDSLRIVSASLMRHGIQLVRDYEANLPDITVEKHKVLQILVNFVRNAKQSCQAAGRPDGKVTLRVSNGGDFVNLSVADNGVGIPAENIGRLFEHGFTTKKDGHGFGLCSSARTAHDLGGEIRARSDGIGTGATFSLTLPLCRPANK